MQLVFPASPYIVSAKIKTFCESGSDQSTRMQWNGTAQAARAVELSACATMFQKSIAQRLTSSSLGLLIGQLAIGSYCLFGALNCLEEGG